MMASAFICGCGKESERTRAEILSEPLEFEKRIEVEESGKAKKIAEMQPDDIIVAVNGYPLRQKDYVRWMQLQYATIRKQMKNNRQEADKYFEQLQFQFPSQFAKNRLLIDDAMRQGVLPQSNLVVEVENLLQDQAAKNKMPLDALLDKFGNNQKYVIYQIAERILIKKLVDEKIPPLTQVDATFVSNTQARVIQENNIASATNMHRRLMLEGFRRDIIAGKVDFHDLVVKYFNDGRFEIEDGGKWETVTFGEMEDKTFEEQVFSANEGSMLPLQEDDDGINLIMVHKKIPAMRDKDGNVLERSQCELLCIRMAKEPLLLQQSDEEIMRDLKNQMQIQAIDIYVEKLMTNGVHKVVYPFGTEFF